jgi:protein-S-isoprenylcysteine O-methyltransferase Ste14
MLSLFFRNLFFTILNPGLAAGLIPYLILGDKTKLLFAEPLQFHHGLGMLVFSTGMIILLACIFKFAVDGRGTLSPADPTKRLVIKGLYTFSRNPMYLGVLIILAGEAIYFQSFGMGVYLLILFLVFNLFIILVEEPRLTDDFKEEYVEYCQKVRRWL